jgi:hypothetical protein
MSATIATSTPSKQIKRETPIRMRSLVTKKMSQDEEKQKLHCERVPWVLLLPCLLKVHKLTIIFPIKIYGRTCLFYLSPQ